MRLLIIEDDAEAAAYLARGLRESGHTADHAARGVDGLHLATSESYDAAIVDRMLPDLDGLAVVAALREAGDRLPVLILSALGTVDDRVRGLRAGGDDYLVKPFAFAELLARLESLARRGGAQPQEPVLTVADLKLDRMARSVTRAGRTIDLKPREFQILELLLRHAGQVVTRTMLLEQVWGYHFDPQTAVIDVQISRLRQKIDKGFDPPLLHTVRGAGYRLGTAHGLDR